MRLTEKSRWTYQGPPLSRREAEAIIARDAWVPVVRDLLPDRPLDMIELGCAPGYLSAAVMLDRPWTPFGIDYSDDCNLYLETLRGLGMNPTLFKRDLFGEKLDRKFDAVCSFGLIEHFRGRTLEELLAIHDDYLAPGGYLVILVPNFTGYQYFWHYLFDRPDLDNHNVDVMQPATFAWFEQRGYQTLYNDYTGYFRVWGNSSWTFTWLTGKAVAALSKAISAVSGAAAQIGLQLRGRSFSPYLLYIAQKPQSPRRPPAALEF